MEMTQQEAIEAAEKYNKDEREKFEPRLEFVAMDENGIWNGYDSEPELDEYFDEWKFSGWKVPLDRPTTDWKTTKIEI
jgi:hypothetical protein